MNDIAEASNKGRRTTLILEKDEVYKVVIENENIVIQALTEMQNATLTLMKS